MSDAGRKLLDALQEAVDGKLTRVRMQDGSTWIPLPQWQPIETAPKDGTAVIIFTPADGAAVPVPEDGQVGFGWFDDGCDDLGNEVDEATWQWFDQHEQGPCHPTHWMPLPEPPVTA